jgi:hypothetical protein
LLQAQPANRAKAEDLVDALDQLRGKMLHLQRGGGADLDGQNAALGPIGPGQLLGQGAVGERRADDLRPIDREARGREAALGEGRLGQARHELRDRPRRAAAISVPGGRGRVHDVESITK